MKKIRILDESNSVQNVYINPHNIASIEHDPGAKQMLEEGQLPDHLPTTSEFSRVTLNTGKVYTAIGKPSEIRNKVHGRQIFHD